MSDGPITARSSGARLNAPVWSAMSRRRCAELHMFEGRAKREIDKAEARALAQTLSEMACLFDRFVEVDADSRQAAIDAWRAADSMATELMAGATEPRTP